MRYIGTTKDTAGRTVGVEIITDSDTTQTVEIGARGSGLHLAAKEALTVKGETNDLFDVIVRQSACVRLKTRDFVPDLFRSDFREGRVRLFVDGITVFDGFILPRTYAQDFAGVLDALDVNCIDRLGAWQWLKWRDVGTGGVEWEDAKSGARELTIGEVIREALGMTGTSEFEALSSPLMEAGGITALDGVKVNETLFLGEDEDSVWTVEEVVEECLRYLNLHIMQDGSRVIVFSWDDLKEARLLPVTRANCYGTGTSLEIGETFNRISVTCETADNEDFIPDPLDGESTDSPYDGRVLYATEYSIPSEERSNSLGTSLLLKDYAYPSLVSNNHWRRDWWVRVLTAPGWSFYRSAEGRAWDGGFAPANEGMGAEWLFYDENTKRAQNDVPNYVVQKHGAALLGLYNGKTEFKPEDNTPATDIDETKAMIIGVGGTETFANQHEPKGLDNAPRVVYRGAAVRLSPSDSETTRYIDISGKIALAPFAPSPMSFYDFDTHIWAIDHVDFPAPPYVSSLVEAYDLYQRRYDKNKFRWLIRRYYAGNDSAANYLEIAPDGDYFKTRGCASLINANGGTSASGLDLYDADEAQKIYPYRGNVYQNFHDTLWKFPALRCMLIVGDKCLVETGVKNRPQDYEWHKFRTRQECETLEEYTAQSFTIGFNPKKGDYIIGQEYDIAKNGSYFLNADGEGTMIPVRKSDNLSGEITFAILGACDVRVSGSPRDEGEGEISAVIERVSSEWGTKIRWAMADHEEEAAHKAVMNNVSAVWLKDFKIKILSDNAKADPLNENDIVYESETAHGFVNPKDDISMRIHSDFSPEDRAALGIRDTMRDSITIDAATGLGVMTLYDPRLGVQAKPEQLFVDWYYRECSEPHVEIEQQLRHGASNPMLNTLCIPAMDLRFYSFAVSRDLQKGVATVRMRASDLIGDRELHELLRLLTEQGEPIDELLLE